MNRILLADDHEIIRTGLKLFISDVIELAVIDEAWDGDSVIEKIKQEDYQLIILDVNMPATDPFSLITEIIGIRPGAKILMFSMNPEDLYAKKYLQLGAKGYIAKTASADELREAIQAVFNNNKYISSKLKQQLAEEFIGKREIVNPFEKLSRREFEIVLYLLNGKSTAAICNALHLKSSTVGTFKNRIFQKLNCKNIIEVSTLAKIYNIIAEI
jgi:Response regulator containing a CheY-like receiver domain and an HTH DNA-binding domain